MEQPLFRSFFMGGFECSCHRNKAGQRLDMLEDTGHTQHTLADFLRLREQGIAVARSGIRWHLIETRPYHYDFSTVMPILCAAQSAGIQVIWDLCHYGWPDDLDIFSPEFIRRFNHFVTAFVRLLTNESDATPFLVPVNEISYFSWAAGDVAYFYPYERGRGMELKVQLVRATIESIECIWRVAPHARIVLAEPAINILPHPDRPEESQDVLDYSMAQYQAWDLISGRLFPELGGHEKYLDIIGVNYYKINQWIHKSRNLGRRHRLYKPFRQILNEVYERYSRPLFVSETGTEGDPRAGWLKYIGQEVRAAMRGGVPVEGICLYPILNYPGWDDGRHCPGGLWEYADEQGKREIYQPLATELQRQQRLFSKMRMKIRAIAPQPSATKLVVSRRDTSICLFTDSLEPSGLGQHMLTLAAELLRRYQVLFVCPPTKRSLRILERAAVLGCTALALPIEENERTAYQTLAQRLQGMQVTIFHCHAGIGWEGHQGIRTARASGVPVVVRTEHLPYLLTDPDQQRDYRALVADVDHFIFVSAKAMESYTRSQVPAERASVVRNGIVSPVTRVDSIGVRQEFGLPARAKLLFTAARMTAQKGHRYLLDALPQIMAADPAVYLLWAGDGPEEPALRRQLEELRIDPAHVIFAGWRNDVPRLLASSNLFVLPSLFEGLPLVVLEALALGVPVIGTDVCGTSETIEDGSCGRLVAAGDSAALAGAIIEALAQPALRKEWAKAGRARFEQSFTAGRMGKETSALYEALLARTFYSANKPATPVSRQAGYLKRGDSGPVNNELRVHMATEQVGSD